MPHGLPPFRLSRKGAKEEFRKPSWTLDKLRGGRGRGGGDKQSGVDQSGGLELCKILKKCCLMLMLFSLNVHFGNFHLSKLSRRLEKTAARTFSTDYFSPVPGFLSNLGFVQHPPKRLIRIVATCGSYFSMAAPVWQTFSLGPEIVLFLFRAQKVLFVRFLCFSDNVPVPFLVPATCVRRLHRASAFWPGLVGLMPEPRAQ